jgi:multiple sugar transport system substrate-binding protein
MSNKNAKLLLILSLLLAVFLVACGGASSEAVEEAASEAAEAVEAAADAAEEVAAEVAEEAEAVMEEAEEAVEEMTEEEPAAEEPTPEPEEEPMDEGPCAPATDGPLAGVDPRGVTFTWWYNHSGSREEQLLPLIDEFNATNECGITVEGLNQGGYNDIRDAVNSSVAAGEIPATLVVGYQNDQAFYQLNDTLADLNVYLNDPTWGLDEEGQAQYYQSFFNQSVHVAFDNQRLGFPPNRSIEMLHYNKTYLEELGFDGPPATPAEFQEMACAAADASESGVGGFVLRTDASAVAAWTYAFGGDILTADGTGYDYSGQATIDALSFVQELATEGEDGKVCAYFFDGFPNPEVASRNALFAMGSSSGIPFYAGDFATVAEETGVEDEYAVAAIPHTTPDPVMNIYGGDVMIVKTTPEQQLAAWEFIKWFTSPEIQAQWVNISGYFPTNSGTVDFLGDYTAENPVYGTALELLNYGKFEPQLISYQGVRDAAEEAFNEILAGADVEETLADLTETANELQEELEAEIE